MDRRMDERMERQKLYTPRHTSYARGIKMKMAGLAASPENEPILLYAVSTFNSDEFIFKIYSV